jgi:K+-transporting ATPase ATPase C chain
LIERDGVIVGSSLIGQAFSEPGYFWSRPSATAVAYDGTSSGASNLGPLNPALHAAVADRVAALRAADPGNTAPVPIDLVRPRQRPRSHIRRRPITRCWRICARPA